MSQPMSDDEYQRRGEYVESMKNMNKSAFIEIARVLKKHSVSVSENRSGIFFDMSAISQTVFEELVTLRSFIEKNNAELNKRETNLAEARQGLNHMTP